MKKFLSLLLAVSLLPQIVFGFSLPQGAEILTSPEQISEYDILGQVGKTGTSGSYLYGVKKQVLGGRTSVFESGTPVTINTLKGGSVVIPDGPDIASNGSFESTPFDTGWTTTTVPGTGSLSVTNTAYTGTQAASCLIESGTEEVGCVLQQSFTVTEGYNYNTTFAGRASTSSVSGAVIFGFVDSNSATYTGGDFSGFTQCFNFQAAPGAWVSATSTSDAASQGCFINIGDNDTLPTTTYYALNLESAGYPLVGPASGEISTVFLMQGAADDEVMVDSFTFQQTETTTAASPISVNLFTSADNITNLDASDQFCLNRFTNGTSTCALGYNGAGAFDSYWSAFDFTTSTKTTLVNTGSTSTLPLEQSLNRQTGKFVVFPSATIDFTQLSTTTLFTVPTDRRLYLTNVYLEMLSADTVTVGFTGDLGVAANGYSDWYPNMLALGTVGWVEPMEIVRSGVSSGRAVYDAGDVISWRITNSGTATSWTGRVYLEGFYIN